MERSVVADLVAKQCGQIRQIVSGKGQGLQTDGAVGQPMVCGHVAGEQGFGSGTGRMLGAQRFV